jgi:hypothetical protein
VLPHDTAPESVVALVTVKALNVTVPVVENVPPIDTLPVRVVAPVTVSAPRVVVPELLPLMSNPPDAPGVAAATLLMFFTLTSITPAVAGVEKIVPSRYFASTRGTPVTFTAGMVPPSHWVAFALTTPDVKSSCPVPVPVDSSTLVPMSLAVCAVPAPVGPSFTVFASTSPAASVTMVRPLVVLASVPFVTSVSNAVAAKTSNTFGGIAYVDLLQVMSSRPIVSVLPVVKTSR